MTPIYIIGSGGFAKEVMILINAINEQSERFSLKGFLNETAISATITAAGREVPVKKETDFLASNERTTASLAIGVGSPDRIWCISNTYRQCIFPNLVHPSVEYDVYSTRLGRGNIIAANCSLTCDISIGNFNILNIGTVIGHDATIGDCNAIMPRCQVSGGGNIGHCNLLGTGSTILQGVEVGDWNKVGAHALLTKSVLSNSVLTGIPAVVRRTLPQRP